MDVCVDPIPQCFSLVLVKCFRSLCTCLDFFLMLSFFSCRLLFVCLLRIFRLVRNWSFFKPPTTILSLWMDLIGFPIFKKFLLIITPFTGIQIILSSNVSCIAFAYFFSCFVSCFPLFFIFPPFFFAFIIIVFFASIRKTLSRIEVIDDEIVGDSWYYNSMKKDRISMSFGCLSCVWFNTLVVWVVW